MKWIHAVLAVCALGAVSARDELRAAERSLAAPTAPRGVRRSVPLSFEANRGQTDACAKFLVRDRGLTAFLCASEAVFKLGTGERRDVLRMRFVGVDDASDLAGRDPLSGNANYFVGDDPMRWTTGVPTFGSVAQRGVWPGIDVVWRAGDDGRLTYDLVVAPHADLRAVEIALEGACDLTVDAEGSLRAKTPHGELRQTRPVAWQIVDGSRRPVDVAFVVENRRMRFGVGAHDAGRPLVVDPSITYSTYLGGSGSDVGFGVAVDAAGAAYVTGSTSSIDFPTQAARQASGPGSVYNAAFVTKLDAAGALVYSTYLSGTQQSTQGRAIAVDASGAAYVAGFTSCSDLPTQGAVQAGYGGGGDAFLAKLSPSGASLVYSTYLGGSGGDAAYGVAVDGAGAAYVVGSAVAGFPLQSPLQGSMSGASDAFVTKVSATGAALVYSTYLGGSGVDVAQAVAVDSSGALVVCGRTSSANFPAAAAAQSTIGGAQDAFAAKLNSSGSALAWSTYLGGSGDDVGNGVALDAAGAAWIAGYTQSSDFPVTSAFQSAYGGVRDAFLTKIDASGARSYSSFLGGSGDDRAWAVTIDSGGAPIVVGDTTSSDFATASATQATYGGAGAYDCFVARFASSGAVLGFSTYLGGSSNDIARAVAVDAGGHAYVAGQSQSTDFPVQSALQSFFHGGADAFVAKFDVGTGGGGSTATPPAAPIDLIAVYVKGQPVSLSWTDASSDETGFRIERKANNNAFALLAMTAADVTSSQDTTPLYPSTTYTYRVRATGPGGQSDWSNEASFTTPPDVPPPAPPAAPTQLTATVLDDGTIRLDWIDNAADELRYEVARAAGGAAFKTLSYENADVTSHIDSAVLPGWPYAYRVRAVSLQGPSPWSNVAGATIPASLAVAVDSGVLIDSSRTRRSSIRLSAGVSMPPNPTPAAPDPVAAGLELQIGFAARPLVLGIVPNDPGWKVRRTRARRGKPSIAKSATWRSPRGASQKATIAFDFVRRTMTVVVSGFDFAADAAPPFRLLIACGGDGGADDAQWPERSPGFFKFVAK